jgi:ribosomal protein S8
MITIRNAAKASLLYTVCPIPKGSPIKNIRSMLNILRKNGIIRGFSFCPIKNEVIIYLKYDETGKSNLNTLYFVSKPGRTVHISSNAL